MSGTAASCEELDAIRTNAHAAGMDPFEHAGNCPYSPRNSQRHRAWMDAFSEGRSILRRTADAFISTDTRRHA